MTPLLAAEQLSVHIAGRALVTDLDLTIQPGERWAVLGPNGAGKTTLLHTLAGLRPAHTGRITWRGRPLEAIPRSSLARGLGLLLQDDSDPFPATVLETALTGRHPHLGPWGWESPQDLALTEAALTAVDLSGCAHRQIQSLSGGERRRLAIATLLVQAPHLALLDEPTNHLDLRHQVQLMQLLVQRFCTDSHSLLAVLHDPNLVMRHGSHVLLLDGKGGWEAGPVSALMKTERLSALYGQPLQTVQHKGATLFIPQAP